MTHSSSGAGEADVLAALRRATASRHALLDAGLSLSGPAPTLADYHSHLLLLDAWLAPEQRLALLRADLAEPCLPRAGALPAALPPALPPAASQAWRWGVGYVVEGAQLGGAVLYQRLAARLAPHPLRYLAGAPEGPGPRWRAFIQALRARVRSDREIEEACRGACAAFDLILAAAGLGASADGTAG